MAGFDSKFTMVAGAAVSFAGLFNHYFRLGLAGPVPYRVELTTPAGPSTGGGKQAMQHIRLVPISGGGAAVVIGSTNPVEHSAEIRTYRHLADSHAQRFKGASLPIDAQAYAGLVTAFQQFFQSQDFRVVMLDVSTSLAPPPMASESGSAGATLIYGMVITVVILGGGALAYFFMYVR